MVKNSPAKQETRVQSLGREGPLEEKLATHSSVLAWRIPWTKEPGGHRPLGRKRVRHDLVTQTSPPVLSIIQLLTDEAGVSEPVSEGPSGVHGDSRGPEPGQQTAYLI